MSTIELRDENGLIYFDATTRVSRVLGAIDCNLAGGSVTDGNMAQGAPWYVIIPVEGYSGYDNIATATRSGMTISYTASKKKCRLIYGTY